MSPAMMSAFVNAAIVSVGVAAGIDVAFRLSKNRFWNASTRYAVWFVAFIITMALPAFYLQSSSTTAPVPTQVKQLPVLNVSAVADRALTRERTSTVDLAASSKAAWQYPVKIDVQYWMNWLVVAWALVTMFMLLRLLYSCVVLHSRKSRAVPVGSADEWLRRCGSSRSVQYAISDEIATPIAAGPFRPYILIPTNLFHELRHSELEQIALHEAAHFARRDDYALLFQRICEAVFIFHPVVHWIARRMEIEREIACDDFVVTLTGRPQPYAECLTRVVELSNGAFRHPMAAHATETLSVLERRVDMLLDGKRHVTTSIARVRFAVLIAGLVMALWLTPVATFVVFAAPAAPRTAPSQPSSLALVIVLDKSGSMGGLKTSTGAVEKSGPKIELAKEASRVALDMLKNDQWFGIVTFNVGFEWSVPLQQVASREAIRQLIGQIFAGGETNIYPALRESYMALGKTSATTKHVILISDGRSLPGDYQTLMSQLGQISVSTVGVGSGADRQLLARLAEWGRGRTYFVDDASHLPEILARETQIAQHD